MSRVEGIDLAQKIIQAGDVDIPYNDHWAEGAGEVRGRVLYAFEHAEIPRPRKSANSV